MGVHKEGISICVRNSVGKVVMESVIATIASTILQLIDGLCEDLRVLFGGSCEVAAGNLLGALSSSGVAIRLHREGRAPVHTKTVRRRYIKIR